MDVYATSFSGSAPLKGTLNQQARQKAEELAAVFLNTLVKEMVSSTDSKSEFGGGYAEKTWRSMQSEQFAAAIARSGGLGIADQIMSSLIGVQQAAQNGTAQNGALQTHAAQARAAQDQAIQIQTYQGLST